MTFFALMGGGCPAPAPATSTRTSVQQSAISNQRRMSVNEASPMSTGLRTHQCGVLRLDHVGQSVRLGGWVHRSRNLGGLVFVDLRDRTGIVQVSLDPRTAGAEAMAVAESLASESVVLVEGTVVARPEDGKNPDLSTGDVEVRGASIRVVGPAVTP